jgi:hypothetical protein
MARMQADTLARCLAIPGNNAVLSTTRKDGRGYLVPVWFLWEETDGAADTYPFYRNGRFWLIGTYNRRWCKHISADPRVSLCIQGDGIPGYVAVDCRAEPVHPKDFDIWPVATRLAMRYVGHRSGEEAALKFVANMRTEPRLLFRLTPENWRCIDLTVYTGTRADMAHQERARALADSE